MEKKILIDASQPEETRVVVSNGNQIDEFYFESKLKKPTRGNIYLAKVVRIEPSLQAAFVSYGGNRHGFLAFNDIHPDYYQIPLADREAILAEQAEAEAEAKAAELAEFGEDGDESPAEENTDSAEENGEENTEASEAEESLEASGEANGAADEESEPSESDADSSDEDAPEESVAAENGDDSADDSTDDSREDIDTRASTQRRRRRPMSRKYHLQEVIKNRQILLVQVVKEERGNKGAALTTYLSLAGRYCVLMPNTERGSGISRKITHGAQRKNLRSILSTFELPKGMGLIVRTAGAKRNKTEIKRDYEYLLRMWENVRDLTLESAAPSVIYEEGDLIKRSIRDLYGKGVGEVIVEGEAGYQDARTFMKMLTPSHVKNVHLYKEKTPIFQQYNVESGLLGLLQPSVRLKSGGSLVIDQTEALTAIDVNSGKATREYNVESTALKTNLEATEEAARQMRLRDLSGLIVIDYIDMMEGKNRRVVESRLKECLKSDRARYQVGSISEFGLLELSRQRMRTGILEGSSTPCPHCKGIGKLLSVEAAALRLLRAIRAEALASRSGDILARAPRQVAFYVLNNKRATLGEVEEMFDGHLRIEEAVDAYMDDFVIERVNGGGGKRRAETSELSYGADMEEPSEKKDEGGSKRRSRRSRGGRGRGKNASESQEASASEDSQDSPSEQPEAQDGDGKSAEASGKSSRSGRSRGSRGRRRRPSSGGDAGEQGAQGESGAAGAEGPQGAVTDTEEASASAQ